MLDIKLIRDNPDIVRQALEKRGDSAPLDEILNLDERRRQLLHEMEMLRAERNEVSKQLSRMADKPPKLIADMRKVGEGISRLEAEIGQVGTELEDHLLRLPNIPAADVPIGKDEQGNTEMRSWGEPRHFPFTPLPHWELGERLGIIDFQRGVKLSGSRFYVLRGLGAHLQRALIAFGSWTSLFLLSLSPTWFSLPSSWIILWRCRRWLRGRKMMNSWSSASKPLLAAWKSPMPSPN